MSLLSRLVMLNYQGLTDKHSPPCISGTKAAVSKEELEYRLEKGGEAGRKSIVAFSAQATSRLQDFPVKLCSLRCTFLP